MQRWQNSASWLQQVHPKGDSPPQVCFVFTFRTVRWGLTYNSKPTSKGSVQSILFTHYHTWSSRRIFLLLLNNITYCYLVDALIQSDLLWFQLFRHVINEVSGEPSLWGMPTDRLGRHRGSNPVALWQGDTILPLECNHVFEFSEKRELRFGPVSVALCTWRH